MAEFDSIPGTAFRKSSYSGAVGNNCVEVGVEMVTTLNVCVRDTKDATGTTLRFTPAEWEAFVTGVKEGEFDLA
jgi:hypothetical protein